jgi:hypothetical protein
MAMPECQKSLQFKAQAHFMTDMTSLREVRKAFQATSFLQAQVDSK